MIKTSARRLTLAVTLGLSTLAAAHAQSTITGTDPEPKSCGCKNTVATPTSSTTSSPVSSTTSTSGTVVQALLVFLGAA